MALNFISPEKRVKHTLADATLLRKGDEKRHHFKLAITLTDGDDTLNGMPTWIQNAYTNLIKSGNLTKLQKFEARLDQVTMEMLPTYQSRTPFFPIITAATLSNFRMERVGTEDSPKIILHFSAYLAARKDIHDWTFDHKTADFWVCYEQQQGTLNMAGDADAESEHDDDGDDDDEVEVEEDDDDDIETAKNVMRLIPSIQ